MLRTCDLDVRDYRPVDGTLLQRNPVWPNGGDLTPYGYGLQDPINHIDPNGLDTTVIVSFDYGFGSHAALFTEANGGMLYDPGGSFMSATRGSGGFFGSDEATLQGYFTYLKAHSGNVKTFTFKTTPAQEAQIQQNILSGLGGNTPGLCSYGVCSVLQGVGPFKNLGSTFFPGRLADQLGNLQNSCGGP